MTIVTARIRGLIPPLMTTHESPSRGLNMQNSVCSQVIPRVGVKWRGL